jgi:apolipoprotein N-acyltransferase
MPSMKPGNGDPLLPLALAVPSAVLAGIALWLSFPPVAIGPSAVVGVALLTAALWGARPRRGLGLGLLAGGVWFLLLLEWMRVIGADAWLLLSLLCAAWIALLGLGTTLVTRLPGAPVWVASVWVLDEALRARIPFGGFPWGNLAFGQADTTLAGWAPLGGSALVTFVVSLLGAAVVGIAVSWRAGARRQSAAWLAVVIAGALVPVAVPTPVDGDDIGGPSSATIALVQGGTPQVGMGAMDVRRAVLDNHVAQTLDLAEAIDAGAVERPSFVLWPENSSDIDPFGDDEAASAITAAARAVGVPILVGAVTAVPDNPQGVWNVGIVWDPESGPTQMYIKTHPVPFGEYIPFRDVIASLVGRFDRIPRDFIGGTEPGNLEIGGIAVGNVICFEIAYREVVDAVVDGGARVITVQTNNATYGGTSQPAQQLDIERLRAIEFGRSVLVAATSGISAVIAPDGSITQSLSEDEVGWMVADVPLRGSLTPASRVGNVLEALICLMAIVAIGLGAGWRRRRTAVPIA